MFSISVFLRGILSRGSYRLKALLIVYFESKSGSLDKFILPVKFSFSTKRNNFVLYTFCFIGFRGDMFLIHDEDGIGLCVFSEWRLRIIFLSIWVIIVSRVIS